MAVRLNHDECATWPAGKVLHPDPSAYSSLTVAQDGTIPCLSCREKLRRGPSWPAYSAMQYRCSCPRRKSCLPTIAAEASNRSSSLFVDTVST